MKNNSLLWIGLSLLVAILIIFFGIIPSFGQLEGIRLEAQVKKVEAQALQKRKADIEKLQQRLVEMKPQIDKLNVALPSGLNAEEIFIMLEAMATSSGLTIDSIQPEEGGQAAVASQDPALEDLSADLAQSTTPTTSNISVGVVGDYNEVVEFTRKLAGNIRPILVNDIIVSAQEDDSGNPIAATINLGFLTVSNTESSPGLEQPQI